MVVGLMCLLLVEVMFLDCFLLHGKGRFRGAAEARPRAARAYARKAKGTDVPAGAPA